MSCVVQPGADGSRPAHSGLGREVVAQAAPQRDEASWSTLVPNRGWDSSGSRRGTQRVNRERPRQDIDSKPTNMPTRPCGITSDARRHINHYQARPPQHHIDYCLTRTMRRQCGKPAPRCTRDGMIGTATPLNNVRRTRSLCAGTTHKTLARWQRLGLRLRLVRLQSRADRRQPQHVVEEHISSRRPKPQPGFNRRVIGCASRRWRHRTWEGDDCSSPWPLFDAFGWFNCADRKSKR